MNYLTYTNMVLQAVNEVPLTEQQFQAARGLQQFAKEAVNRAYHDVAQEFQWPWLQETTSALTLSGEKALVPTGEWTPIPVLDPYRDAIDWSSIYYKDSEDKRYSLVRLTWEEYEDNKEYYDGRSAARYIVESADGRSMGLIPYPETNIGTLYFRYWKRPTRFQYHSDEITIPDMHYNVIIDGALHHLWSFRGNVEQAQLAYARFEKGIKQLKLKYTNQSSKLRWV